MKRLGAGAAILSAAALLAGSGSGKPPRGVLLVSVDTLRADHLEPWGAPDGASPTWERLAGSSVLFEQAYANANETLLSHGSLFTSRIPSHVADLEDFTIPDGVPTLARAFADAGWRTGAVTGSGHLARAFGLDDGFQDYSEGTWWGSFQETVPMGLKWLERAAASEQPFFFFLHGYDCHTPYLKPTVFARLGSPGYDGPFLRAGMDSRFYERVRDWVYYPGFPLERRRSSSGMAMLPPTIYAELDAWAARDDVDAVPLSDEDVAYFLGSYRSAVLYADLWLGVLLDELDRMGLLATTTVVLFSDHGEALMDDGYFNHRQTLHDASTRVPLLVRLPGGERGGQRVPGVVTLMDVAPTLLELAGVEAPAAMRGKSLAGCVRGAACEPGGLAYSEGVLPVSSVTDGRWRLVVSGDPTAPDAPAWLYDVREAVHVDHLAEPGSEAVAARLMDAMREVRR